MASPKTVIVIPCFNEAERFDFPAFTDYLDTNPNVSYVFVDDGSIDDTARLIKNFSEQNNDRAYLISHDTNLGKAEAVRSGILYARTLTADAIGFLDADLATPLGEVDKIVSAFNNVGTIVAIGYRPLLPRPGIERDFMRRMLQWVHAGICSICLTHPFQDTQCGAKFFRNDDYLEKVFFPPFVSRWLFDLEILTRYQNHVSDQGSFSNWLAKIPLDHWQERVGSHINGSTYIGALRELYALLRTRLEDK